MSKKAKKNPVSNCCGDALVSSAKTIFPNAAFDSPIIWASLTKGKFMVKLPKAEQISKDQLAELQEKTNAKIAAGGSPDVAFLKGAGVFDDTADGTNMADVKAIFLGKFSKVFNKPGSPEAKAQESAVLQQWIFDVNVGDGAVASMQAQKAKAEGGAAAPDADAGGKKKKKKGSKKGTKAEAPTAKAVPLIPSVKQEIGKIFNTTDEAVLSKLDQVLQMMYNQAYTDGFSSAKADVSVKTSQLL